MCRFLKHEALLTALLLSILTAGCQEDTVCEDVTSVLLSVGFYSVQENGQEVLTAIDSISIFGIGKPSQLIYDNQASVSRVELPVNPATDSTTYVMQFPGNQSDTIRIFYQRHLNLISVDCGFSMFFEIDSVAYTRSFIQTHTLNNKQITNTRDEHLKIFVMLDDTP